jgi:hypothetical protein
MLKLSQSSSYWLERKENTGLVPTGPGPTMKKTVLCVCNRAFRGIHAVLFKRYRDTIAFYTLDVKKLFT